METTTEKSQPNNSEARLHAAVAQLQRNSEYYGAEDSQNPTLGTFAIAALRALEQPFFIEQLRYVLSVREELEGSHLVKLLERCYQADLLENDSDNYPLNYRDKTVSWLRTFHEVDEHELRYEKFMFNLLTRNVQSNIAERYKTIKILAQLYKDRFEQGPSHLDVGSSVLHGSLKLAYNDATNDKWLSFGDIELSATGDNSRSQETLDESGSNTKSITRLANNALKQTVQFGPLTGTDITNVDDPSTKRWIESCSFYPDELLDPTKRAEYRALESVDQDHQRVGFVRADFSNAQDIEQLRESMPPNGYDLISFFTIFYQISSDERRTMLRHARELLSQNGLIIIQDAHDGNFSKNWNYKTHVIDASHSELGAQEILKWKTPRCNEAAVGIGRLSINGRLVHLDQALQTISD